MKEQSLFRSNMRNDDYHIEKNLLTGKHLFLDKPMSSVNYIVRLPTSNSIGPAEG